MIKHLNPIKTSLLVLLLGTLASIAFFKIKTHVPENLNKGPKYEAVFKTGLPVYFTGDRVSLGKCEALNAKFIVYDTVAVLQFEGRPDLRYKVIGIDHRNGLHLFRFDSVEIVVYQVADSTDTRKVGVDLLFRQPDGSFLLLPGSKCPF